MKKIQSVLIAFLVFVLSGLCFAGDGQWSVMIRPKARILNSVWGNSETGFFAVGDCGTILRSEGNTWQFMESPTEANLTGIWGTGKNSLFAVGEKGTLLRYDGILWQQMNSPAQENLNAVRGRSGSDIFAAGENGRILRYDGNTWSVMNSPTAATLYSIWESQGSDVFAVGGGGTVLRYDGTAWNPMSSGDGRNLRTVWRFSSSDVYAAGLGTILHYDGRNWQLMEPGFYRVLGLWGTSGTDLYAVGASLSGQPASLWYNGSAWKDIGISTSIQFNSIWGDGKGTLLAVGGNSEKGGVICSYDGHNWQEVWHQPESELTRKMYGVRAFSENDVFAVGEAGSIMHYDGSAWEFMDSGTEYGLWAIWGISGTDLFAAGKSGTILHYDGNAWQKTDSGSTSDLYDIWGYSDDSGQPSEIFAVGDKGTVLHRKDEKWEVMDSGVSTRLEGVWGFADEKGTDVFAAGYNGVILRCDGREWELMESPVEKNIRDIWGYADESGVTVLAAGDRISEKKANFLRWDGMQWSRTDPGRIESLRTVWGNSGTDIFVTGSSSGFIGHYDGKTWNAADSGREATVIHMHGIPKSPGRTASVFAVDSDGAVLHHSGMAVFLPEEVKEGDLTAEGTVLLPAVPDADVQVFLTSDDPSEISVPAFVTVPAGQTSAVFPITVSDDTAVDGTRSVIIRASAANCNSGSGLIRVHDNETAVLSLILPNTVFEGDGLLAGSGTLVVSPAPEKDVSVSLHSDHPDRLCVSRFATVPAGRNSVTFDMLAEEDEEVDNAQTVIVTASVRGWPSGSAGIQLADNDRYGLILNIPDTAREGDEPLSGTVSLTEISETDTVISLTADNTSEISVPETVTIPAGSISAVFEISPAADWLSDNPQSVSLTAVSPGFAPAKTQITVTDSDGRWQPAHMGTVILRAVWGSSEKDVFAVGWYGMIMHYDGLQWEVMDSGTEDALRHVWGYDGNTVFAVGGDTDGAVIVRYDGETWTQVYSHPDQIINWVWGTSPDNVYAAGQSDVSGGIILHYDGQAWNEIRQTNLNQMNSVWGSSADDVFVSGNKGQILHWDGLSWTVMTSGTTANLRGLWGSRGDDVFAVSLDTIMHYDGKIWSLMEGGKGKNLYNTWGSGPDNVYVTGSKGVILHYDGKQWQEDSSGTDRALWGIWGSSADNIFASGVDALVLHNDGTGWKTFKEADIKYTGIWGFSSEKGTEAVAVGEDGSILHYDGTAWKETGKGIYPNLNAVWGRSPWEIYAVGNEGTILNFNGIKWHKENSGTYVSLYDVWGLPDGSGPDVFAAGDKGTVLHFDGEQWQRMNNTGTELKLQGIWAVPADNENGYEIFAAGFEGIFLHFDGQKWQQQNFTTKMLFDVWGTSAKDVYVSGAGGGLFHYDGYTWHQIATDTNITLRGLWGSSASDVYVPGYGMILHWDGSDWIRMTAPERTLNAIWGISPFDMFAAGDSSTIMRYTAVAIHVPELVSEGSGILSAQGRVSVSEPPESDLSVRLTSHDPSEVSVPDTVVIPAGQSEAFFDLTVSDDAIADGTQRAAVTTAAAGYSLGTAFVRVSDNETAVLKIQLPERAREGDGILTAQASVFLQTEEGEELTAEKPVNVSLLCDCPAEITVPDKVIVPAGQSAADFDLSIIDDTVFDGPRTVRITASVEGWTSGSADMEVHDNEEALLMLDIPDTVSENDAQTDLGGTVSVPGTLLLDLTIDLFSDRNADIIVPENVTISAGQSSADFTVTVNDDPEINGDRSVLITASVPGWDSAEAEIIVTDNDPGEIRFPSARFSMWKKGENITVPVCRYNSSAGQISVCYNLEDTASGIAEDGTLVFENGEKEKQISIFRISERGEKLTLSLSDPGGGAVLGSPATAEIMLIDAMSWSHEAQITENHLRGIWGTGSADVFAVGWSGTILHYDGSAWKDMSPDTAGNPVFLEDVWGSSGNNVFAVGHKGVIGHYDGEKWGAAESGTNQHLYAIWGPAGAESGIFAAGAGVLMHYDGTRWNEMTVSTGNPDIRDIWGENANNVYAVGTKGLILHYDGQTWQKMESGTANHLYGVWGCAPLNPHLRGEPNGCVFAVGSNGVILHYDGSAWQEMAKNTNRFILFLESVWGQSPNNVFAAGSDGIILHYDGNTWTECENLTGSSLSAMWGPSGEGNAADIFAVGESGTILHLGAE
ncbi:MAG: WD40/YVTN/BNR-like repeat-containing protein [Desulfococcaceae bacterium]